MEHPIITSNSPGTQHRRRVFLTVGWGFLYTWAHVHRSDLSNSLCILGPLSIAIWMIKILASKSRHSHCTLLHCTKLAKKSSWIHNNKKKNSWCDYVTVITQSITATWLVQSLQCHITVWERLEDDLVLVAVDQLFVREHDGVQYHLLREHVHSLTWSTSA